MLGLNLDIYRIYIYIYVCVYIYIYTTYPTELWEDKIGINIVCPQCKTAHNSV